ncbi:MAG TPA: response regulator [Chitinophagales bacterium]|nr:response regulator [Chitinophagales bacterium]HRK28007.1 response regulator [Chitinophagales bacterium]
MFDILLVEDSPGDIRLTQEALKEVNVNHILHVVTDGEEALKYLFREEPYTHASLPDIIMLDLNLPKINGKEVLARIKEFPELKRIPVIVLSTSNAETDIMKMYDLHANCYITKPVDFASYIEVIASIEKFWLNIVRLPTRL